MTHSKSSKNTNNAKKETLAVLKDFLRHRIVYGENVVHTYTSMEPRRKYCVQKKDLKEFFNKYSKAIKAGNELHITEKHRKKLGIFLMDIDMKFAKYFKNRKYSSGDIKKIIKAT